MRRPPARLLLGALVALSLALTSCGSSQPSAAELLAKTTQQVSQQSAVHFIDVTTVDTDNKTVTGDIGPVVSQETLTANGQPVLQVRLIHTTVYLYATSASVLETALKLPASEALGLVNTWIQISSTDAPYNAMVNSLTIDSEISVFYPLDAHVRVAGTKKIHGAQVTALTGPTTPSKLLASEASLFVDPTTSLPAAATLVTKSGSTTSKKEAIFREWGVSVSIPTPTSPVAFSSLPTS